MFEKYKSKFDELVKLPGMLKQHAYVIDRLIDRVNRVELEHTPPFVLIFLQGLRVELSVENNYEMTSGKRVITNRPVTAMLSGYAPNAFSIQPDIPIANIQVAIICDVSKVRVEEIKIANVNLCPSIEAAPLAYFEGICDPCNRIMIHTSLR